MRRLLLLFSLCAGAHRRDELRTSADAWAATTADCPCKDASLCKPVSGPPVREREIFGFGGGDGSTVDWSRVTSVAWPDHPELVCAAHAKGARVIVGANSASTVIGTDNATARKEWVATQVEIIQSNHYDGVTFDWESPCPWGAPEQRHYSMLVAETRAALRAVSPSYQVSVCVAWSPDNIDGRGYDVVAFAAAADLLYVMDYDTRSQVYDACLAAANAPLPGTMRGIGRYLDLGIAPSQLILGVPWYGYRYPCEAGTDATARFCPIELKPFRGVNCSDAAGSEVGYAEILRRFDGTSTQAAGNGSTTGRKWDANQGAPYFNTVEGGTTVQYWYDDPQSLMPKYRYARQLGLRGVGPFTFSDVEAPTDEMYKAFDAFLLPG